MKGESTGMEIRGQVEDIIYSNEVNGYTVCTISSNEEIITAVGYLPFVNTGDVLVIYGEYTNHNVYGRQFKIDTFEKAMPDSIDEIEKYLGSGIVKGVGPATAKKIINKFGTETIYVLRLEPYKLSEVPGITSEKAIRISEEFNNQWGLWQIVLFLQKYGIGVTNATRVYKEFGMNAIDNIKENPYILLNILYGVDFKNIDRMAIDIGIDYDSTYRISSGIIYALKLSSRNGHTCVLKENLMEYVANILDVEKAMVSNEITALCYAKDIYEEDEYIFLKEYYIAEENIAKKLLMMCNDTVPKCHNLEEKMENAEKYVEVELSVEQKNAIRSLFNNKVTIITGGPGTGKTTIIKAALKIFQMENLEVALCAPTGRASKRITETTNEEAKTLHRLLEIGKIEDDVVNIDYEVAKINKDIVIVDEMSMVDIILMNYLMKGLLDKTRLILIGDSDQLPSVGPGSVLKDLINSDIIPTVKLKEIHRQAKESQIVTNAHRINNGEDIDITNNDGDFFFTKATDVVKQIIDLSANRLSKIRKL